MYTHLNKQRIKKVNAHMYKKFLAMKEKPHTHTHTHARTHTHTHTHNTHTRLIHTR